MMTPIWLLVSLVLLSVPTVLMGAVLAVIFVQEWLKYRKNFPDGRGWLLRWLERG